MTTDLETEFLHYSASLSNHEWLEARTCLEGTGAFLDALAGQFEMRDDSRAGDTFARLGDYASQRCSPTPEKTRLHVVSGSTSK